MFPQKTERVANLPDDSAHTLLRRQRISRKRHRYSMPQRSRRKKPERFFTSHLPISPVNENQKRSSRRTGFEKIHALPFPRSVAQIQIIRFPFSQTAAPLLEIRQNPGTVGNGPGVVISGVELLLSHIPVDGSSHKDSPSGDCSVCAPAQTRQSATAEISVPVSAATASPIKPASFSFPSPSGEGMRATNRANASAESS